MEINEPFTDREILFSKNTILVSKTDGKGIITYANNAFVTVSGYSEAELLGRNHNVVRHPEMPREAFKDLWDKVQVGQIWTGLVKNRAKNGDYHWVRENVTRVPIDNDDVEYMSVCTKPSEAQKRSANELYAQVRTGQAKIHPSLHAGSL